MSIRMQARHGSISRNIIISSRHACICRALRSLSLSLSLQLLSLHPYDQQISASSYLGSYFVHFLQYQSSCIDIVQQRPFFFLLFFANLCDLDFTLADLQTSRSSVHYIKGGFFSISFSKFSLLCSSLVVSASFCIPFACT